MWGFKFPNRDTAHHREPLRGPLSTKGSPGVPAARSDPRRDANQPKCRMERGRTLLPRGGRLRSSDFAAGSFWWPGFVLALRS